MSLPVLMRNGTIAAWLLLTGLSAAMSQSVNPAPAPPTLYDYCQRFQRLYIGIREQKLSPEAARRSFRDIMLGLRSRFYGPLAPDTLYLLAYRQANRPTRDSLTPARPPAPSPPDSLITVRQARLPLTDSLTLSGSTHTADSLVALQPPKRPVGRSLPVARPTVGTVRPGQFVFPIRGYGPAAIGGTQGDGYRGQGFDLFDYKVRGSHPAQDIFVRDGNQDHLDDRTGRPVDVLAMRAGVVLAIETGWEPGSEYRGGNWIWLYDPVLHGLWYYAHNHRVKVKPGQWVEAGQKISEMGRTGFNAYQPRSPTHLHLMYLQIRPDGLPHPGNPYKWLLNATVSNKQ